MSSEILESIKQESESALITVCWRQWHTLGAPIASREYKSSRFLIDPEGLVLVSLGLLETERRLSDVSAWWMKVGSELNSIQRFSTLLERYPPRIKELITSLAIIAVEAGDKRWKKYVTGNEKPLTHRNGRESTRLHLNSNSAMTLRLRAAFGVGLKSDLYAYLISSNRPVSAPEIADDLSYTIPAVREALSGFLLAGVIQEKSGRPAQYWMDPFGWTSAFSPDLYRIAEKIGTEWTGRPEWRFYGEIMGFLLKVSDWASARSEDASGYTLASQARDLLEDDRRSLEKIPVRLPFMTDHLGEDFLPAFDEYIQRLSTWITASE